jgi:predicted transcriptional regulator
MVQIEITSDFELKMKQDNDYVRAVLKGRKVRKTARTLALTPSVFAKIFSRQRINLLLKIKTSNTKSIYQIAKELHRRYEAVYRDIKLLEGFGLIKIQTQENRKLPYIDEPITIPTIA